MSPISITSIGAALLNYRKAKAEYETLKDQQETLRAAVAAYNYEKYDDYESKHTPDYSSDAMDGVRLNVVERVGNLVGNHFRSQASVVLTNTSDNTYSITGAEVEVSVGEKYHFVHNVEQKTGCAVTLHPGETVEIALPASISQLISEDGEVHNGVLRDMVCTACGKKLVTSCYKVSIENALKCAARVYWKEAGEEKEMRVLGLKTGILRYCGEAFFPKN